MRLKEVPLVALHWQAACCIVSQKLAEATAAFSYSLSTKLWPGKDTLSKTTFDRGMRRKLVWIEEDRFRGFACSECSWRFESSTAPTGKSFDEMMQNFELQRDKAFASHVCADHPRTTGSKHSI
jgi:hypothetical protein